MNRIWNYFYTPREVLFPYYPCELCVGQEYWQGCHCKYYDAWSARDSRPPWWARIGRHVYYWAEAGGPARVKRVLASIKFNVAVTCALVLLIWIIRGK